MRAANDDVFVVRRARSSGFGRWTALVGFAFFIWGAVSVVRLHSFTCPRCRRPFFGPFFGFYGDVPNRIVLPDLFVLWHCSTCRIETGTPRGTQSGPASD